MSVTRSTLPWFTTGRQLKLELDTLNTDIRDNGHHPHFVPIQAIAAAVTAEC